MLVRRNKELVTKEELLQAVWPDTFVEENNLSRNVFLLRKAMGGSAQDHQYIITVPGRGYRFAEDVRFARTEEADLVAPGDLTEKGQSRRSWPWDGSRPDCFCFLLSLFSASGSYHVAPLSSRKRTP